jgi:hypothetical protein
MMQKVAAAPYSSVLFIIFGLSQLCMSHLQADEMMNITDVKDCQGISGDAERLTCYDTVSRGGVFNEQELKQVQIEQFGGKNLKKPAGPVPVEPVPAETKEPASTAAVDASEEPESSALPATKISVDEIQVTVVRVKKDGAGFLYFQTSDGQVWKQQSATSWSLMVPFDAKIEKGMMGSFFLVSEGGKSTRVTRLK